MEQRDPSMISSEEIMDVTLNPQSAAEVEADETVKTDTESAETAPVPENGTEPAAHKTMDKAEIIESLRSLSEKEAAEFSSDDVNRLKQYFYAIRNEEIRAEREAFEAEGGAPEAFVAAADADEERFKELVAVVREKKAAQRAELEAQLQTNYEKKLEIIDKLNEMSADADNVNRVFPTVRELQTEFKEIGDVPQTVASELWKKYQEAVEKFYDQLKINKELRDYDFKKNLTEKEALVAEAEKLGEEPDVIIAFKRLQELHDQWRAIGPVPKEVREEIWGKFKGISAEINRKYQDFFLERKAREQENETAKTAICERLEALDFSKLQTYAAWDEMTAQFLAAQEEWKKLGYASRKSNNALFARFRTACDAFFAAKAEFFKDMKSVLNKNLERKIALCERAEALKDSTDWRATADELAKLQKEWKTIGTVARKHSDAVWQRFLAACDHFFDQKKKNASGTRRNERANLEQKHEIIDKLKALAADMPAREEALKAVKDLQAEWQSVGHVPFAEKDKVYEKYRAVVNGIYEKLDMSRNDSRRESLETSIADMEGDSAKLMRERERTLRVYEQRRSELQTYENNMGFLSARSKNADSMLREMQRRMQRLRDTLAELEAKIKLIDSKL